MEKAQVTNGEQSRSAIASQNIDVGAEGVSSTNDTTTSIHAALVAQEGKTDIDQLRVAMGKMTASLEKARSQIYKLIAANNEAKSQTEARLRAVEEQANIKTLDLVKAALEQASMETEKKIKAAIDEERSKPPHLRPRNLVVCIGGTSNQFGPKVRLPISFSVDIF